MQYFSFLLKTYSLVTSAFGRAFVLISKKKKKKSNASLLNEDTQE